MWLFSALAIGRMNIDFFFLHWVYWVSDEKGILKRGNEKAETSATWQPRKTLRLAPRESWNVQKQRWSQQLQWVCCLKPFRKPTVGQSVIELHDALEC